MKRGDLAFYVLIAPLVLSGAGAALALMAALGILSPAAALPLAMLLLAAALLITLAWIMRHDRVEGHRQTQMARLLASMQQRLARLERDITALLETPRSHGHTAPAETKGRTPSVTRPGLRGSSGASSTRPPSKASESIQNPREAGATKTASHLSAETPSPAPAAAPHSAHDAPAVSAQGAHPRNHAAATSAHKSASHSPSPQHAPAPAQSPPVMRGSVPGNDGSGLNGAGVETRSESLTGPWLEGFRLYMEPIVDRHARKTVMYRALPALARGGDHVHLGREAQLLARNGGFSAALDVHVIGAAAAFLRRLREHGQVLPVIAALSEELFLMRDARALLGEALKSAADVRDHLVLEVPQSALASMGNGGVLLLAWLAGLGVRLCLGEADPEHMDPQALATLGFAWADVALPVLKAAPAGALPLQGAPELIVSGVSAPAQAAALPSRVRLVRGRLFAPPRRLKEDILAQAQILAPSVLGMNEGAAAAGALRPGAFARGAA